MRDSSKQYLHGFQIPLEGRVCTAAEQTTDGHLFSSLQYVVQNPVAVDLGRMCAGLVKGAGAAWRLHFDIRRALGLKESGESA